MQGEKYAPSNGSEGEAFTDKFCMQCQHCNPDPTGEKQCEILMASLVYDLTDERYPKEWVYDSENKPTCTAHKFWDWQKQVDPDDPANENYQQPEDPQ